MKRSFIKLLAIVLSFLFLISCGKDENVIATVGDLSITKSDLAEMVKTRYPKEKELKNIDLQKRKDLLDQIVQKKLKVQAALEMGLENDPEIVKEIKKKVENVLSQKYFETVVVDKLIPAEEIDEFIARQGVELKVTYILIGHENSRISKERSKEEAKTLADKIVNEAKNGKDFNELALQYSDDPSVKSNKGNQGYFKWGQKPMPFQQACWEMKVGEISEPIETSYGYNIIRLDDRKELENYTPDRSREAIFRIKQTLYSTRADSGKKLWEKTYENLKQEKSYRMNSDGMKEAAKLMAEKAGDKKLDINSFSEDEKNIVFAEWEDGQITFNTILSRYQGNLLRVIGALRKEKNLENEVNNLSMINLALSEAKRLELDEEEDIAKDLQNFREDRLAYLVEKKQVNEKVTFTEEEVKKFYDEHPDQFMKPAQMEMWDIEVKTEKEAKRIAALARKGRNFESLAKKYSEDKYYKKKGGYLGFRNINARSSISRKAFEMGPNGKISDPIKYKNKWAVVKTGILKEAKLRPFQEVKRMAEGRLRNNKMVERRKEWKNKLSELYPVKIYEEHLANF